MTRGIKRAIQVYIFHGLWMLFVIYKIFNTNSNFGKYSWVFILALTTISFINLLIKRYYIEVDETSLIIHQDYFRTKSITLKNIEIIEIEPSPFKSSTINLKDKTKVKFNDTYIDIKELKEALTQISIEVD